MKKRTAVLVLATVLSLSVAGCGKNEEPKQQEQEEMEQEEEQETEKVNTEQEFSNGDIVIKVEDTTSKYILRELEYEDAEGAITPESDIPIYCEDGYQIGHINAGAKIEITEHALNSAWYRFPNPINGTSYNYIYVSNRDIDMDHIYCDSHADVYNSEEPVAAMSEEYIEQQKMYDESMSLIDEDKTYTVEEFHQLMKDICEIVGTEYDSNIMENPQGMPGERTLNLNGKKLKQFFEEEQFIWWLMMGPTGNNEMDVYIYIEDGTDTSGDFKALVFPRYHKE